MTMSDTYDDNYKNLQEYARSMSGREQMPPPYKKSFDLPSSYEMKHFIKDNMVFGDIL